MTGDSGRFRSSGSSTRNRSFRHHNDCSNGFCNRIWILGRKLASRLDHALQHDRIAARLDVLSEDAGCNSLVENRLHMGTEGAVVSIDDPLYLR